MLTVVDDITSDMKSAAGGNGTSRGTGGMATKLKAAAAATEDGINTVIMNGYDPEDIFKLFEGRQIGTFFKAKKNK